MNVMPNSFWKLMTKFNFLLDVAAMALVKLDIMNQHYLDF